MGRVSHQQPIPPHSRRINNKSTRIIGRHVGVPDQGRIDPATRGHDAAVAAVVIRGNRLAVSKLGRPFAGTLIGQRRAVGSDAVAQRAVPLRPIVGGPRGAGEGKSGVENGCRQHDGWQAKGFRHRKSFPRKGRVLGIPKKGIDVPGHWSIMHRFHWQITTYGADSESVTSATSSHRISGRRRHIGRRQAETARAWNLHSSRENGSASRRRPGPCRKA